MKVVKQSCVRHFLSIVLISVLTVLCIGATNSAAVELSEKLIVSGFLENQTGVRLQDHHLGYAEQGDLSLMRSTLQIEPRGRLTDNITYSGKVRGWYEAMYDLDEDIDSRPEDDDENIRDADLHHLYVTGEFGNWNIQVGKQELVWGESDLFRMADVVNPLDISWHYLWPNLDGDGYRIPLRMIVVDYISDWHNFTAEAVVIPEDFQPWKLPPEGGNFFPPAMVLPVYDFVNERIDQAYESSSSDNTQWGLRLKGTLGGADASIFYLKTKNQLPVLNFRMDYAMASDPIPFEVQFEKYDVVGLTLNYYEPHTKAIIRFETAYNFDNPYTNMAFNPLLGAVVPVATTKDTFAYMIGIDRESFLGWPKGRTVNISFQMFQQYILDIEDDENIFYPFMEDPEEQTMFTLILNTFLGFGNKYMPQILVGYDVCGAGVFYPSLKYTPTDYLTLSLNYTAYWGDANKGGYFNPYEKNDEIWLQVRLKF